MNQLGMHGGSISSLGFQLAVATLMVVATVTIHGSGLFAISNALGIERKLKTRVLLDLASVQGVLFTTGIVLALVVLHGIEIAAYATLFSAVGALPDYAQSLYFSTITYAAIGYDDLGVSADWKMVAAIEGINGIILLGWSTAFLVTAVSRISRDGG